MPDKELHYQGTGQHEDEDLASPMNAFSGDWKCPGAMGESGREI